MSYTEVTSTNWFSRLGGSLKGILFGLLLIPIAIVLLFWNEGREVRRTKALNEGEKNVVSVSSENVDTANDGKLVYLTGHVSSAESVKDAEFGISPKGAIKLQRNVLYYQYKESSETRKEKKLGGGEDTITTYTYAAKWVEKPIDSSKFKDPEFRQSNRVPFEIDNKSISPKTLQIGTFNLPPALVSQIKADTNLPFPSNYQLPDSLTNTGIPVSHRNNDIYIGDNPNSPDIGDIRVSFSIAEPADYSLIAQQKGSSFVTYQAKHGTLSIFKKGTHSVDSLFAQEKASNKNLSWILRAVGFVLMLVGFNAIFKPLSVVLDVIPFLGNIAEIGTGLIAFVLTFILSATTIAIAWLTYRPLIGGSLLVLAGAGIYWLVSLKKKQPALA